MTDTTDALTLRTPSAADAESAAAALAAVMDAERKQEPIVVGGLEGPGARLAPAVGAILVDLLAHLARGETVGILRAETLLTPTEAAGLLGAPRGFVTGLVRSGALASVVNGGRRRVRLGDVLTYRTARDARRATALDEIARLGQTFDAA